MKNKLNHNKFKNTGLLFELLVANITTEVINNNPDNVALKILKKFFKKDSLLSEEFSLYQTLLKTSQLGNDSVKHELINKIIEQRKKIDKDALSKERYKLVESLKKYYNLDELTQSRIPNYKLLATIYKLFEYDLNDNPLEYSKLKNLIIETSIPKTDIQVIQERVSSLPEEPDLRILAYKLMIKKFNKKYDSILSANQKNIVKEYINNVTNSKKLTEFIKNKLKVVTESLKNKKTNNAVLDIKINEVVNLLENLQSKYIINDNDVIILMNAYELLKHLK